MMPQLTRIDQGRRRDHPVDSKARCGPRHPNIERIVETFSVTGILQPPHISSVTS